MNITLGNIVTNPTEILNLVGGIVFWLAVAVVLVMAGWILGTILKHIVANILKALQLDDWAAKHKLKDAVGGVPLSRLAGSFVKWYVIFLFLQVASFVIGLEPLTAFLNAVVLWLPRLIAAALLMVLGLLVAKFVRDKIMATNITHRKTASAILEFLVLYMAFVLALENASLQVTILVEAFKIAFTAFAIMLAIILGIGFGLAYWKDIKQLVMEIKKDYRM